MQRTLKCAFRHFYECTFCKKRTQSAANDVDTWVKTAKSVRFFQVRVTRARNVRFCENGYLYHNFTDIFAKSLPYRFADYLKGDTGTNISCLLQRFMAINVIFMKYLCARAIFRVTNSTVDFLLCITQGQYDF